jgi:hypothetical protein
VNFTDLDQPIDDNVTGRYMNYTFGNPIPADVETVSVQVHYALVFEIPGDPDLIVWERHRCLVEVVVWR